MRVALRKEAFDIARALQTSSQHPMNSPVDIVIDHAAADDRHCEALCMHLRPILAMRGLSLWTSFDVLPGRDVAAARDAQLGVAKIPLLLISPDYLSELSKRAGFLDGLLARSGQGRLPPVPILARESGWLQQPLGRLKPLPADGRAVAEHRIADEGWTKVLTGLIPLLDTIATTANTNERESNMTAPTREEMRKLLNYVAVNDTDLRMLCIDHLDHLMRQFSLGMGYDAMVNIIVERTEPQDLLRAIEKCDGLQPRLKRYRAQNPGR